MALIVVSEQGGAKAAEPDGRSLEPPVLLPDGSEFRTWEEPLSFSRTWHVAQGHPKADDANPGTDDLPLATIRAAAEKVQPGERVLVHEGVYRERVRPARGGTGPSAMVSYEAAEGESVVIRGSDAVDPAKWETSTVRPEGGAGREAARVWMLPLDGSLFPGVNPFAMINARGKPYGFWYPAYTLRRGLVFQDGRRLAQVHTPEELLAPWAGAGRYWVEGPAAELTSSGEPREAGAAGPHPERLVLHVRPFDDRPPAECLLEITTREQAFAPDATYLGYVRVKGFTIEQVANPFPRPQLGALSASRGHHWLIEENTVRWANSIGIDAGHFSGGSGRKDRDALCGYNVVRGNTLTDCGICGIAASEGLEEGRLALKGSLFEDNRIARIGWHGCEALMENAAIKLHVAEGCVVRRNLIEDTHQASGIWLDWQNVNSRVTQNVILNTGTVRAGIFVEATFETNAVDTNVIWGCRISRDPEYYPREYGGFGVLTTESRNLVVAHNLIAGCEGAGVMLGLGDPKRAVRGQPPASHGHMVLGNVVLDCRTPVVFPNADNAADHNVYGGVDGETAWRVEAPERKAGFREWRDELGFDAHGSLAGFAMALDRIGLALVVTGDPEAPVAPRPAFVTHDVTGAGRAGELAVAGPLSRLTAGRLSIGSRP